MSVKILQINFDRGRIADSLMYQMVFEKKADIVLVQEQYRNRPGPEWIKDTTGTAAIWIANPRVPVEARGAGRGYAWISSQGTTYFSCYLTPNESIADFEAKLAEIEGTARSKGRKVLVAGDFNARAPEWGVGYVDS